MSYLLINGDSRRLPIDLASVDAVVSDPPYGVGFRLKRAKHRNGKTLSRLGCYGFDDSPEYVRKVVVPVIEECRRAVKVVVVTPGSRNTWSYPQPDELGCFYSAAATGIGKWGFTCSQPILYYGKDPYLPRGARPNSCGQTWPNDANQFDHPCAKPIRMALWLIERTTLPGWTVLDPFMGVGTFGVACLMTGRNFVGIEIDRRYCVIARRRITRPHARPVRPSREEALPLFDGPTP